MLRVLDVAHHAFTDRLVLDEFDQAVGLNPATTLIRLIQGDNG